jgi:hypothetical protein
MLLRGVSSLVRLKVGTTLLTLGIGRRQLKTGSCLSSKPVRQVSSATKNSGLLVRRWARTSTSRSLSVPLTQRLRVVIMGRLLTISKPRAESRLLTGMTFAGLLLLGILVWAILLAYGLLSWLARKCRLIDCVENHGVGLDWYVSWLRDNKYEGFGQILPHDVEVRELGTGRSRKEVLQEAGLDITVAPRLSVADGIQAVRRILPRCWFDHKTKAGLDAIRNYRREYNEKQQVFYDKPLHDWSSHYSDAFRYLAIGLDESDDSWSSDLPINTKWVV